jgi:LmbE family N-acetylglucosaminyl deacetylase
MTDLHPDLRDPRPEPLSAPRSALAIGAHPDDIEFGAGATVARWTEAGCRLTMAVVTDGSKGTWDRDQDPAALAVERRREQQAAADVLGATEVVFLGHIDGMLTSSMDHRSEICRLIRRIAPEVVLSHDPWQRYQLHPDHRATGFNVVDGVVAARDHLFFPEQLADGLEPHRPGALLLWAADEPNHWEDAAGHLRRKIDALLCHVTQHKTTMGGSSIDELADRITRRAASIGAAIGLDAAEAFRKIAP